MSTHPHLVPLSMLLLVPVLAACANGGTVPRPAVRDTDGRPVPSRAAGVEGLEREVPRLLREGEVPGASIALVEDGRVVWARGFGVADARTGRPVESNTVFEAASLSKPVFAYGVMKLVESGRLDLDAPLSRYLPAPYVEGDPRLAQVTARRVLSHTTGFPNWRPTGKPLTIGFTPGERFSYSGEGYVYLQRVVEQITGEPLDAYMRRAVLDPLEMTESSYVWQDRYDTLKAYGHDATGKPTGRDRPAQPNAAASLHTTAVDYARFVAAVLRGDGLRPETLREMLRPQVTLDEGCVGCISRSAPARPSPTLAWGLGWGLQSTERGEVAWHWGDNGDMKAYVAAVPGRKRAVVLLTNGSSGLTIAPEVVRLALGIEQPQFAWLGVEPYDSPAKQVLRDILARGATAVREQRARMSAGNRLTEAQVNGVGYALLAHGRIPEAVEVLEWNVEDHPDSWNAHDSMGEAYLRAGNGAAALREYRRSLELNPGNSGGVEWVRRLETPVVALAPATLDAYVGEYALQGGKLTVSRRGDRLFAMMEGQGEGALVPWSATRFWVENARPELEFIRGADGRAAEVVLHAGGQELRGKRIR